MTEELVNVGTPRGNTPWHFDCTEYEDTGWMLHHCTAQYPCGRNFTHAPHDYVSICFCRPTNRTYQRHNHIAEPEQGQTP